MGRETYLVDLYRQSVQALTQNRTEWMGLLSSVSKYYKMSFDKNVLIYVQRPDAGLLATKMGWEKQTGRYLKAGSKGIGVVDMNNPKATLAYYFDLADTRGDYEGFRRAMSAVWSLERQYQPEILDRFHKQFGTDENSIENCLCQLAGMQADAFFEKYLSRVEVNDENSVLYGLPAGAVQAEFAKLVSDSAAYIVFKKCGIRTEIFEETGAFENISHFGSLELFMGLGYYTCAIARPVLSEIHKQIEEIKEERSQRYESRTVSETGIHERGGRDAVSEPSDIREQGVRLKTDRDVREKMEGLHEVEVPTETVGADRTGADKRADSQGGRGSRSEERNADSAASGSTADAGDRGYAGESRTHGDDNQTGGGDHPARSSVPVKIAEKEVAAEPEPVKKNTEKASEESEAENTASGSFFRFPESATKENITEHKDWEEVQSLLTDTGVFPLELYDRINQVFAKETDPAVKRNAVRDIYLDYGLQKSSDGTRGIMPGKDVADFFFGEEGFVRLSWDVITHVIDFLMQNSEYIPYHEEEDAIGDFNIPDEIEDMQPGSRKDHEDGQLSLFELYPGPYEDDGKGGDQILPEETEPEEIKSGYMPFPVGSRIAYDDRIFEVLQYLDDNHTVELGDIEQLQGLHGYKVIERLPVVLIENAELLQPNYTEGEVAQTVVQSVEDGDFSEAAKKRIEHMSRIGQANEKYAMDVAKEMEQRFRDGTLNYHYQPEHRLYEGGPKAKFRNNVEAIRLLKQLQQENRIATTEEQIVLARFVGWGGLANALTPGKEGWEKEYDEISELLTEEEMQSASASTLTSYYTDQKVIESIYQALYQFGFRSGNILDPALGTGNFFSALPESMNQSRLYGVELEPIAGGIARKLYPQADILIKGYEDTEFSDSFFDVVVGNVPFHNIKVSDRRYDRYNFKIHDYFLAKSLDKVRSGGILAVITTKFTMDKENQSVRKYIAQRAELIGAIRLPENAFKQVAGTEATTDILFLKKREQEIIPDERNTPWLSVEKDENGIPYNSYFIDHPKMVLGTMAQETGMYGSHDFVTCKPYPDKTLSELLEEAVGKLHGHYEEPTSELSDDKDTVIKEWIPATPDVKNYSYTKVGDVFYYREDSRMYRQELTGKKAERVDGMLRIRDALRELMDFQLHGDPELEWELPTMEYEKRLKELLDRLNREYDSYIKKYGYLNSQGNVMAFSKDADAPLLRSIEEEVKDEHGKKVKGEYKKTAVFHKATIRPKSMPKTADNVEEALRITMNAKGKFDLDYMQYLYRKDGQICSKEDILEELGERVYQDPAKWQQGDATSGWVLAEEYLSGYVKDKLAQAVLAEEEYPEWFGRNVEALKKVQPEPLKPEDISFVLGSTWIPVKYYQDFMYEKFATSKHNRDSNIHIEFAEYTGTYFITEKRAERDSIAANKTYGTERLNAYEIMEYTLNLKTVEVRDRQEYEDPETGEEKVRYVLNKRETLLAREKQAQIKMEFESWLFAEPERGAALTQLYNDRFNNIRPRTYNGDDLMLPDMNDAITLRKHQRDMVAMGIYSDGNLLVAHEVGAGKTMTACAIAYERKRLGVCNKPLIAVPNHTLEQWATEFMRLYPNANILVATNKDFEKPRRRRFVSRIATGDYDCIIMGHSSFELIALSRERQLATMQEEIDEITKKIDEMKMLSGKTWSLKQMEIFRHNLQDRFDRLYNAGKKDGTISFEELGVDNLFVDEAHAYKNNYHDTEEQHSTQLIFCDKGTPKADGRFNFYQALRQEMVRLGVEEKEIAFIHDANTDTKRAELLEKVRNGIVRVLLGSTEKMGTGLNVQDKLIALHNLDAPWRPADLTQRNGRILRQGNENDEISIFNYITEQTFDAYLWQILEQKQRYISQIMTGRSALRSCEDVDEVVLQYAEFKALAVSDPKIKRKMEVDNEVYRLQTLKSAWKSEHTDLQNKITVYYPQEIKKCTERIEHRKADAELYQKEKPQEFSITLNHRLFDERTKAGEYLKMQMANLGHEAGDTVSAGTYAGLQVMLKRGAFQDVLLCLKGEGGYQVDAGESALGNITRLENLAEKIPQYLKDEERKLGELKEQFEAAKVQAERPFSEEEKLSELLKEQVSLNLELEFADADEEGTEKAGKSHGNSIYRKLHKLAPELFEGTYTYMKFKQDGFDDLVLETIGENEYSIAHYYTQNGDRMRDPEITFMLDDTQRCIYALSYTQDNMGIYYETGDRTEEQMEDLMGFFDQWMANIKEQGFTLYKAYGEDAEYTKEEEHTEETESEECCV